jgi:3',5'-cyclic-AMP phosphodiesterase
METMLVVAQITDTHLFADDRGRMFDCPTNANFAAVINALAQSQPRPALLLWTGDISQDETAESYRYGRSQVEALQIPTYWLPGNHDQNPITIEQLNGDFIRSDKVVEVGGWRFILLNSVVTGEPGGYLAAAELQWLEQQLANSPMPSPTLVALHHHPLNCGIDYMDGMKLSNAADLFALLDRYPQVKVVLCGHIHHDFAAQRGTVSYFGTPATSMQLKPNQAAIDLDSLPPGFRLLRLYPDGRFETEVVRVALD